MKDKYLVTFMYEGGTVIKKKTVSNPNAIIWLVKEVPEGCKKVSIVKNEREGKIFEIRDDESHIKEIKDFFGVNNGE